MKLPGMRWGVVLLTAACAVPIASAQDIKAGETKAASCIACHGPGGQSMQPTYPSLAGQTARYIYLQLKDFKEGRRSNPIMGPIAKPLSTEDMLDLGAYFAAQHPMLASFDADPAAVSRGKAVAADALCTMCHLGQFKGQNEVPRVAGQQPQYIAMQLKAFRDHTRTNDAGTMAAYTKSLTDQQIKDLAQYIGNLDIR